MSYARRLLKLRGTEQGGVWFKESRWITGQAKASPDPLTISETEQRRLIEVNFNILRSARTLSRS